jgi:hypothetical protein
MTINTPALDVASGITAAEQIVALPDAERPTRSATATSTISAY